MINRFFKLLYILGLITIVLSLPIYIFSAIHFDRIILSSHKAKCISNNQYVVLQGAKIGDVSIMDELYLNGEDSEAIKKQLNFYCKYYDEIQPHIVAYNQAKTLKDTYAANLNFVTFRDNVYSNVYSYPQLYQLEVVSEETHLEEFYAPMIAWIIGAIGAFLILQILRICYLYVVFGKVVWHPFK